MCGRFLLNATPEEVRMLFGLPEEVPFPARYNIAPTQPVGVVRASPGGRRQFSFMRWGLVPSWVADPSTCTLVINARAESLDERPAFRDAFRSRRCLVPASGFYEWGPGRFTKRQPYWMRPRAARLIAFAGLYETWTGPDGTTVDSVCIVTVPANAETRPIHDRMPAVIALEDHDEWLAPGELTAKQKERLLRSPPDGTFEPVAVDTRINAVSNEGPDLLAPPQPQFDLGEPPGRVRAGSS
jgi:putative SOS response-associated peptidase YedK